MTLTYLSETKQKRCPYCGMAFASWRGKSNHMKAEHNTEDKRY